MSLKKLHEAFIEKANRKMTFGSLPIEPKKEEVPIIATNRWHERDGSLVKQYQFRRDGDRDRFVIGILEYEREVKHNAVIVLHHDKVTIKVSTHNIDKVTELDREYARFADVLFRDVVYDPVHE